MLESAIFLLSVLAFVYIVYWSAKNDNIRDIKKQTGLLRMKIPEKKSKNITGRAGNSDYSKP